MSVCLPQVSAIYHLVPEDLTVATVSRNTAAMSTEEERSLFIIEPV